MHSSVTRDYPRREKAEEKKDKNAKNIWQKGEARRAHETSGFTCLFFNAHILIIGPSRTAPGVTGEECAIEWRRTRTLPSFYFIYFFVKYSVDTSTFVFYFFIYINLYFMLIKLSSLDKNNYNEEYAGWIKFMFRLSINF